MPFPIEEENLSIEDSPSTISFASNAFEEIGGVPNFLDTSPTKPSNLLNAEPAAARRILTPPSVALFLESSVVGRRNELLSIGVFLADSDLASECLKVLFNNLMWAVNDVNWPKRPFLPFILLFIFVGL